MTEKTLLVENPFSFEQNAKKDDLAEIPIEPHERLYQDSIRSKKFGIIRALDEEAEKIAKAREESLAREIESQQAWKKGKQKTKMWEIQEHETKKQQYRIKNILKEKRETIAEFVKKKRQIFLTNMNINNKKEETLRLEDFIKNEQESLKARNYYFTNDCQLVKKFMDEVKEAADQAQKLAEEEAKRREMQKDLISKKNAKIESLDNQISRLGEEFGNLKKYKDFIDKVKENYQNLISEIKLSQKQKGETERQEPKRKQQNQESGTYFLTEIDGKNEAYQDEQDQRQLASRQVVSRDGDQDIIPFSEKQLVEMLNDIEQTNLTQIQTMSENKGVLEKLTYDLEKDKLTLEELKYSDNIKIQNLENQKKRAEIKYQNLKQLRKFNTNKVKITEGEDLDMEMIGDKINEIFHEMMNFEGGINIAPNTKQDKEKQINSKEMKAKMKEIEKYILELQKYTDSLNKETDENLKKKYLAIKNKIKLDAKMEKKDAEKAQEAKVKQEEFEAKSKKRDLNLQNRRKGRPLMGKSFIQQKKEKEQVQQQQTEDDEQKYFREEFDMGIEGVQQKK